MFPPRRRPTITANLGAARQGELFEIAQMMLFEIIVVALRERLDETAETMGRRRANLE